MAYPEIIRSKNRRKRKRWSVRGSAYAEADLKQGVFTSNLTGTDQAAYENTRELVKLKCWSLHRKRQGVDRDVSQAVEELRMDIRTRQVLGNSGQLRDALRLEGHQRGHVEEAGTGKLLSAKDCEAMNNLMVNPKVPYAAKRQMILRAVRESVKEGNGLHLDGYDPQRRSYRACTPGWSGGTHAARLDVLLEPVVDALGGYLYNDAQHSREAAKKLQSILDWLKEMEGQSAKPGKGNGKRGGALTTPKQGEAKWGQMTMEKAPLTKGIGRAKTGWQSRATDEGTYFRYPSRFVTDGCIFGTKRRLWGGTVLIDISGSMDLEIGEIDQMIDTAPAATVAVYWGSGNEGWCRIVAQGGRRCLEDEIKSHRGCHNVVDGMALRWLAREGGPRVWISDGYVTGKGEVTREELYEDASRVCSHYQIVRVLTSKDAMQYLTNANRAMVKHGATWGDHVARAAALTRAA